MIRIRQCITPADFETAKKLEAKVFPWDDPYTTYPAKWWIAWDGDTPVGFSALHEYEPGSWYLARAGVLRSHRGRNLQVRLIRVREAYARRYGAKEMITYVAPGNMASANNLLKCGYRLYDPALHWGMKGAIYFIKEFKK